MKRYKKRYFRTQTRRSKFLPHPAFYLVSLGGEDVTVALVDDGHGGDVEELSAGGAELDVGAGVVVHVTLGKHRIVLKGGLAEGGAVVGDEDKLGLVAAKGLEGGLRQAGRVIG